MEAIEELQWIHDVALDEDAREDCRGGPEACADGHFPKPCFEGEPGLSAESSTPATHHLVHVGRCRLINVAMSGSRLELLMLEVVLGSAEHLA